MEKRPFQTRSGMTRHSQGDCILSNKGHTCRSQSGHLKSHLPLCIGNHMQGALPPSGVPTAPEVPRPITRPLPWTAGLGSCCSYDSESTVWSAACWVLVWQSVCSVATPTPCQPYSRGLGVRTIASTGWRNNCYCLFSHPQIKAKQKNFFQENFCKKVF